MTLTEMRETDMDVSRDASASVGAREFHKKTGITENLRQTEQSFQDKFVDLSSGKVKDVYVTRRPCPLCSKESGEVVFVKNGFDHLHCSCGMIYVADVLKDEYLNMVYADEAYAEETHNSFRTEPRRSFISAIYEEGMALIKTCRAEPGRLLDVGCSSGLFMEFAQEQGYKASGIEPSQYAVEYAQKNGLDAHQGYFKKGSVQSDSYDLVTLWDVLEHCDKPSEILNDINDALEPGGIIFLQVPNVMGLAPRIMRKDCNMFTGFGHINLFGPETLTNILKQCGYTDIRLQSVISEISVITNYLAYYDPYLGPSMERKSILGLIDLTDIQKNLLGYKLQAVALKAQKP